MREGLQIIHYSLSPALLEKQRLIQSIILKIFQIVELFPSAFFAHMLRNLFKKCHSFNFSPCRKRNPPPLIQSTTADQPNSASFFYCSSLSSFKKELRSNSRFKFLKIIEFVAPHWKYYHIVEATPQRHPPSRIHEYFLKSRPTVNNLIHRYLLYVWKSLYLYSFCLEPPL